MGHRADAFLVWQRSVSQPRRRRLQPLLVPLALDQVVAALRQLADEPWVDLIDQKVNQTIDTFQPVGITLSGYKFTFTDKKSDPEKYREEGIHRGYLKSVGFAVTADGVIEELVPHLQFM